MDYLSELFVTLYSQKMLGGKMAQGLKWQNKVNIHIAF